MRILLVIVHHWNPEGSGKHQSLRPDPQPRIQAFQQLLLCLQRQGSRQSQLQSPTAKHLGFEAQRFLATCLEDEYDLYGYMEDDLLIHDPMFFHKINWFREQLGDQYLLLPHRMELPPEPHWVEKFYIDGPLQQKQLEEILPEKAPSLAAEWPGGKQFFESPQNPHAGCFFLSPAQLHHWTQQPWWQDGDCSWVSPLESAATLGIAKTFLRYYQ